MMSLLNSILPLLLLCISIQLVFSFLAHKVRSKRLPPGPYPLPIIGNFTQLIGNHPHKWLADLAKVYGPLMTIRLGYQTIVVVSSVPLAREVLQTKDAYFSNRFVPDALKVHDHPNSSIGFLPPSTKWRTMRKICATQIFAPSKLDATKHLRREKILTLLSRFHAFSETGTAVNIGHEVFGAALNFLSNTLFSVDLAGPGSKTAREIRESVGVIQEVLGEPNLADFFPLFKVLDPQRIRRRSHISFQKQFKVYNALIDERLQRSKVSTGVVEEKDVLDALIGISQKGSEFRPSDIPHLIWDLFIAGSDSISSTVEWAMAELLCNPMKLKKAQEELDKVLGRGSQVEETDITRLPYLRAIIKETLRLHPAAPFLVPRKSDTDVELSDFIVPKNAQVWVNVWAMGRDCGIWEDAKVFNPERFLGTEIDFKGRDFELIPFGAGRRQCAGIPLANRFLHCVLGSLLISFEWKLEDGTTLGNINMDEKFGLLLKKEQPLLAIPVKRTS